jgi:Xaa-Pro aminopeptidase
MPTRSRRSPPSSRKVRSSVPTIALTEFAQRRERVLRQLARADNAIGLVLAGEGAGSLDQPFRANADFRYLTGIDDEPGAMLLLDPAHPVRSRRVQLYLRPLNPEVERWDGLREMVGQSLRKKYGVETILRTGAFGRFLLESARRSKRLACLHALASHNAPLSPDLAILRDSAARIPGAVVMDLSSVLPALRAVKSADEVRCIEHAGRITGLGFAAAREACRPGANEFDVQEAIEHAYRTNGSRALAFRTIAGGGVNGTVLHYHANDCPLRDGDLLVIDSGAAFGGYASDVTRTLAVSGRFTARQRLVYDTVLRAQSAAIRACRPGTHMSAVDRAARKIIEAAGFGDFFSHGIGHHLGLEVHDSDPATPLEPGMVVTIEPGIYIQSEAIGVRIEDDVLVTRGAPRVLTAHIPK